MLETNDSLTWGQYSDDKVHNLNSKKLIRYNNHIYLIQVFIQFICMNQFQPSPPSNKSQYGDSDLAKFDESPEKPNGNRVQIKKEEQYLCISQGEKQYSEKKDKPLHSLIIEWFEKRGISSGNPEDILLSEFAQSKARAINLINVKYQRSRESSLFSRRTRLSNLHLKPGKSLLQKF